MLAGALFLAGTGAPAVGPEAAYADATPNMIKTVRLHSEGSFLFVSRPGAPRDRQAYTHVLKRATEFKIGS